MAWSPNSAMVQQVTIDVTGSIEAITGAPHFNTILKDGGNRFRGDIFGSFANKESPRHQHHARPSGARRGVAARDGFPH